jgi:WD40 repeat protein
MQTAPRIAYNEPQLQGRILMRHAAVCAMILSLAAPVFSVGPPVVRRDALGDPLPRHALFRLGSNQFRAPGVVSDVALSPDGRIAAATGKFPGVWLWDLPSGRLRSPLEDPAGRQLNHPVFSADGKTIAATANLEDSPHNGFCVWNVASGRLQAARSVPGRDIKAWAFSPDGKVLAGSRLDQGLVLLFDATTGRTLRSIDAAQVAEHRIAFSPCGKLLAVPMRNGTVHLFRVASGKAEQSIASEKGGMVLDLAFSPDGHRLAILPENSGIEVWDLRTDKQERTLSLGSQYSGRRIRYTNGGRVLVAMDSNSALFRIDAKTGKELSRWARSGESFRAAIDLTADEKDPVLLSEWGSCQLRLVDLRGGREIGSSIVGHPGPVDFLAISPDSRYLAAGCSKFWSSVNWSPVIRVWDLSNGKPLRELAGHTGSLSAVVWSPDGKRLVSSSTEDESIRLWDPITGVCLSKMTLKGFHWYCLAVAPHGKHFVAYGWKIVKGEDVGVLGVWDVPSMKQRHMIVTGHDARELAFLDEVTVTSLEKGYLVFRDVETLRPARPAVPVELMEQLYYSTSIDGSRRAGRGSNDKLCILESDTGMVLVRRTIRDCIFALSHDGDYLAMTTTAGLIELFDATSGDRLAEFRHPATELDRALALTPDRSKLISSDNSDGTILVWDVRAAMHRRVSPVMPLDPTKRREHWTALGSLEPDKVRSALLALRADPRGTLQLAGAELKLAQPMANAVRVRQLIAELDDDSFQLRQRASQSLAAIGEPARKALEQASQEGASTEVKRRAAALLRRSGTKDLTEDQLRALRAVRLLERIGGTRARRVLERLAEGSTHDPVTRAAVASLRRLKATVGKLDVPSLGKLR